MERRSNAPKALGGAANPSVGRSVQLFIAACTLPEQPAYILYTFIQYRRGARAEEPDHHRLECLR